MPDFTIELREVVARHGTNSLGLDSYPIFDEAYRDILNQKIIDHFWYNEISHETVDMWMRQMRTKMQEIMPYYNKLYEAELIKIDPLSTQDVTSTSASEQDSSSRSEHSDSGETTSKTVSKSDAKSRTVQSQLPQVRLSGDKDYATAASDVSSDSGGVNDTDGSTTSRGSGESSSRGSQSSETRSRGYTGHTAQLIAAWRDTFINVDLMIIVELQELFMGIRSTNDSFTGRASAFRPWSIY